MFGTYCFILSILLCITLGCKPASDKSSTGSQSDNTAIVSDPLPSWNDGDTKKATIDFVTRVTKEGSADFIPTPDRIATFDNDGTLWSEQPLYFQFFFAIDQVKAMAPDHPEWKNKQPFKAVLENNMGEIMKQGEQGMLQIVAASHSGMTTDQFETNVRQWIDTAKNPVKHKLYKELVYEPMVELIKYLQVNQFKTFIVSGGGIDFIRAWTEDVYGISKENVIGSSIKAKYEVKDGKPDIIKVPELDFIDDKEGKPVGIAKYIGRKPVFAAGNSDGDYQMLQYTASQTLPHLEIIVHHTDSDREWKYDRGSPIGTLEKGLDDAAKYGWVLVDMQKDWKRIYPE